MYIEPQLREAIKVELDEINRYPTKDKIEDILNHCGIWRTHEEIKEDHKYYTLEDCFCTYYFIIDGNKILFTYPDHFIDDVHEYVEENYRINN